MVYGFFLIYLRDFAPGKEQWIADNTVGSISNRGSPMGMGTCLR
jgi:hypothetical protein